jgi:peptidyl-prolyl cis-trans isomerase A (cyclophilin A)
MVNKPRRRKEANRTPIYLAVAVVVVLIAASTAYAYNAGLGPFTKGSGTGTTTGTTTRCTTKTLSSVTANSTAPLYARVNTTLGSFDIELFYSQMPTTVTNFVRLVDQGFYDHLVWHRIVAGFVIQTGDPTTRNDGGQRSEWGTSSSCAYIPFEYTSSLKNNEYYVAMASTGNRVGGSSQFYINLGNNTASLDPNYAVFGKVVNGTSVVQQLGNVPTENVTMVYGGTQSEPQSPVYVISIKMISGP